MRDFEDKKVLLFGSDGFIGRHLKTEIEVRGGLVTGVDKRTGINMLDPLLALKLPRDVKFDFVIHAAGDSACVANPLEVIDVMSTGTRVAAQIAIRHHARMLLFSSMEIYGDAAIIPTPEWEPGRADVDRATAYYRESKRIGEVTCHVLKEQYDLDAVIVRPANIYGVGARPDDIRIMPSLARRALAGETLQVYGTGKETRSYCYVTDAVEGFLLAMTRGRSGEAYNIGDEDNEISSFDLAVQFGMVTGSKLEKVPHPNHYVGRQTSRMCPNTSKAREELGFEMKILFHVGMNKFWQWAQKEWRQESVVAA